MHDELPPTAKKIIQIMKGHIENGTLWIRLSRWNAEDIQFMFRMFPQGKMIKDSSYKAFFRPADNSDPEFVGRRWSFGGYDYAKMFSIVCNGIVSPLFDRKCKIPTEAVIDDAEYIMKALRGN